MFQDLLHRIGPILRFEEFDDIRGRVLGSGTTASWAGRPKGCSSNAGFQPMKGRQR
jgi:hypothetical protein